MTEIIPSSVLNYLPFASEPFSAWDQNTDLLHFLCDLFDQSMESISQNGGKTRSNSRDYGEYLYREGITRSQSWIQRFLDIAHEATPVPGSVIQEIVVPNFNDARKVIW